MTEDQAKTKWCPMVRMNGAEARFGGAPLGPALNCTSYNRNPKEANCIASGCMMWRSTEVLPAFTGSDVVWWIKKHREIFGSTIIEAKAAADSGKPIPGGGYCGLGGKP